MTKQSIELIDLLGRVLLKQICKASKEPYFSTEAVSFPKEPYFPKGAILSQRSHTIINEPYFHKESHIITKEP